MRSKLLSAAIQGNSWIVELINFQFETFRHLAKINFVMYVLATSYLKEAMKYVSPIFLLHHLRDIL